MTLRIRHAVFSAAENVSQCFRGRIFSMALALPGAEGIGIVRLCEVRRCSHRHRALRDSRPRRPRIRQVRLATERRAILPLPKGEGRGEWEATLETPMYLQA